MRLIASLGIFFAFVYLVIAIHMMSYDRGVKIENLEKFSSDDLKISRTFKSKEYKEFVYAK